MTQVSPPRPIDVRGLFAKDRDALLELLVALDTADWTTATVCAGWNVHDVALHILDGDLTGVSRRRDGLRVTEPRPGEGRGSFLNRINKEWVSVARRLSPRVTLELLRVSGPPLFAYLEALDPLTFGEPVSWAAPGSAPVWLDVAREYMERWVHQQHIRDAVGRPGQGEPEFVRPVIAASMNALPIALARHATGDARSIVVEIDGAAGGVWSVLKQTGEWELFEGASSAARTRVSVGADEWWRVVTLGMRPEDAWAKARIDGDPDLARAIFAAVAILA